MGWTGPHMRQSENPSALGLRWCPKQNVCGRRGVQTLTLRPGADQPGHTAHSSHLPEACAAATLVRDLVLTCPWVTRLLRISGKLGTFSQQDAC